jgi:hypothetical protein
MTGPKEKETTWLPAYGFKDTHEVSDDGLIRSWVMGTTQGRKRLTNPRMLSCRPHKTHGYVNAVLLNKTIKVHRLVLESFIGPCPAGMECAHNDGNPGNNRLENLRWATRKENHGDKKIHGTIPKQAGDQNGNAKLTSDQVKEIKKDKRKTSVVAKEYGVAWTTIDSIKKGLRWKSV